MEEYSVDDIRGVISIENNRLFPIHWLNDQSYCEYKLYLEHIKGIEVAPTPEMVEGKEEHHKLYSKFAERAEPTTWTEILELSKTTLQSSREVGVKDLEHGIYGRVDEIVFAPDALVVIDDKRSTQPYPWIFSKFTGIVWRLRRPLGLWTGDQYLLSYVMRQQVKFTGSSGLIESPKKRPSEWWTEFIDCWRVKRNSHPPRIPTSAEHAGLSRFVTGLLFKESLCQEKAKM